MIKIISVVSLTVMSVAALAGGSTALPDDPATVIQSACQYDIGNSQDSRVLSVVSESSDNTSKTYRATFQLSTPGKPLSGILTFNCGESKVGSKAKKPDQMGSGGQTASEPVLGPRALIESEDAGGRYARTVAWQRPLPSARWSADVAYVNSIFGDGQRSPLNLFLICDRTTAVPCIEATVSQQAALSKQQQQRVLEFLGRISPSIGTSGKP